MKNIPIFLLSVAFLAPLVGNCQMKNEDILMTLGKDNVTVGEFVGVYKKNNNKEGASLDKKAMEDYLNLYTVFRLKVMEAKELGIDTTAAFVSELSGYKKTLAQPYMTEKEVIDNLVKEAYDRMRWDVRTSHILVGIDDLSDTVDSYLKISIIKDFINGKPNVANLKKYEALVNKKLNISKTSAPRDTLAAFNAISPLKKMMKLKTHDFASVAKVVSEHGSKNSGGDIGYLTGLMGQGYPYEYESAAFRANKNEVYGPFRTSLGYHLIVVTDKRMHTELHLEHCMFMFRKNMTHDDSLKLKMKVDSISNAILKNKNFEEVAKSSSEHKETAKRGGDIGWLSLSSNFPEEFKQASFALTENGMISGPVKTRFGWHLIKRIASRNLPPFDSLKIELKAKVQKDVRANVAKDIMLSKLKTKYLFTETLNAYKDFYPPVADSTLSLATWSASKAKGLTKPLFKVRDKTYTQQDFAAYIEKNSRQVAKTGPKNMIDALYQLYVEETILATRENSLESEYPEFKMIMNEYRDGILLFNLTDQKVWTKALKDTTGAKEYYEKNKEHFLWDERLDASVFTCKNKKTEEMVRKLLGKNKAESEVVSLVNKDTSMFVFVETKYFLKGENPMLDKLGWTPGVTSSELVKNKIVFANIHKILKPTPKTYAEARGLLVSEYQTGLEKEWVDSLKKKYPVSINKNVFDSIH